MAEPVVLVTLGVAVVNALLSGGLLALYGKSYSKVRAPFTVGLMIFASCFLAQSLLAVYAYLTMMDFFPAWLAPYMLGVMVAQAAGLGVMVYSASR